MVAPSNSNAFRCERLACNLSVTSCVARWHRAQEARTAATPDSMEICKVCDVGAAKAGAA
jgi:hypothetical protein